MGENHLNHSLSPYGGNNFHHLHPYPAKSSSGQARHHPPVHHSHSLSSINLTQNLRYFNDDSDLSANDTSSPWENTPLNRHHRNATSSPIFSAPNTSSGAAAAAALLPVATTTLPTLLWSTNLANRSRTVDWNSLHKSLNGSVVSLIDSTTPLQPPLTVDLDGDLYDGSDADTVAQLWPTSQEILIGAIVGGGVLLIVLIILLVIWNCCDRHGCCNGGRDKSNFNNGNSDRSNRSSLSAGSCGSGAGGSCGAKRNSSNLYINNPNSLEVEASCGSPDALGTSTTATIHPQHGHYHFTNYDYGPGPGGGVAQLVIGNSRVLATAVTTSADNAIPRSVSVPLSRSNSRKESGSSTLQSQHGQPLQFVAPNGASGYVPCGEPPARSQLSQALTRNIAAYYETQRKKNAKSKGAVATGAVAASGGDKSAIILNDLSLNMDMVGPEGHAPCGNVIMNRPDGTWVMLDSEGGLRSGDVIHDLEANHTGSEFYRTRSLPWSQSSRGSGKFVCTSVVSGAAEQPPPHDSSSTIHSTTTMGRVNFTKNRRNRMRNDSAAAIALNRSGFLGGSLDWDFNRGGRGDSDEPDHTVVIPPPPPPSKPVTLPATLTTHSTSANLKNPNLTERLVIAGSSSTTAGGPSDPVPDDGGGSPDSAEYIANDAIVVYNERTAL